jgi:BirA family biotin operon repressor/biotin-[acetyl-CoA-carboxylase] ligase
MISPPFDINYLCRALKKRFPDQTFGIDLFDTIDSTNRYLLEKDTENLHICLAEQQTAGRGRLGKTWVSPAGVNLYLSILWPVESKQLRQEGLSSAVGVTVAKMLGDYGVSEISLKWPNDIWCGNKKIGGILIESTRVKNQHKIVIGIGINVFLSRVLSILDSTIDQPWIDIASAVTFEPDRNQLVIDCLTHLIDALSLFEKAGFSAFQSEWLAQDALLHQSVILQTAQGTVEGISRGIDEGGRLMLETAGKITTFVSGEILRTRLKSRE